MDPRSASKQCALPKTLPQSHLLLASARAGDLTKNAFQWAGICLEMGLPDEAPGRRREDVHLKERF